MASDRRKNLVKLRLVLSVIAVLLAGLMAVSGVMHFVVGGKLSGPEEAVQPTDVTTEADSTESSMETGTSDTPATEETEQQVETSDGEQVDGKDEPSDTQPPDTTEVQEDAETTEEPADMDNPGVQRGADKLDAEAGSGNGESEPDTSSSAPEPSAGNSTSRLETGPAEDPESDLFAANEDETVSLDRAVSILPIDDSAEDVPEQTKSKEETAAPAAEHDSEIDAEPERQKTGDFVWAILFWVSTGLLAIDLAAILVLSYCIHKENIKLKKAKAKISAAPGMKPSRGRMDLPSQVPLQSGIFGNASSLLAGTVHQVGGRGYQQDSLGLTAVLEDKGALAVLADGMGGLSGGEKVSQKIVMNMLALGNQLKHGQTNGVLWKMVNQVNEDVNRMLGPDGLYKSGSTLVAVLACGGQFQWIAVGDSRIYLYRQGYASQLNRDHDQLQAWMPEVLEGRRSLEEVLHHPDGRKLTSFIGMGQLKHVDGSLSPIALEPGDRLVLMSDGIYSAVSEEKLAAILKRYPDVNQAASVIESMVREAQNPHQDNYTAIVLGF